MPYINNMEERALALLASQFRGLLPDGSLTNFQKLIKSFTESSQDIEDVIEQLRTQRNLDTAIGVQLDGLGEILGLERRDGETDDNYRERLRFQSFINSSNGTPEELIKILAFLTNGTEIGYIEFYPAAFQMSTNGTSFPTPVNDLNDVIQSASPASVQYVPITATYGVDLPFVFGQDATLDLLWITDPSDTSILTNLELDTTDLLYINPFLDFTNNLGGGFSEALGTYPTYTIDTTGAGQLAEVIYFNGNIAPTS